jgi:hypothetical protein
LLASPKKTVEELYGKLGLGRPDERVLAIIRPRKQPESSSAESPVRIGTGRTDMIASIVRKTKAGGTGQGHANERLGNRVYHLLRKTHVPWAYCIPIVSGIKTALHPVDHMQRRRAADRLNGAAFASKVHNRKGYWLFGADDVPGSTQVAAECAIIFRKLQESGSLEARAAGKKVFLRRIFTGDDFVEHPIIGSFAISTPVLEAVAGYFGSAPILTSICLFWSPPNDTAVSSQRFHIDGVNDRQLKLFINVWEHDERHGPLTFYPASVTEKIVAKASPRQRRMRGDMTWTDEFIYEAAADAKTVRVTGEPGSGVFVDTSRCLHFGSRGNTHDRLMLMIQYAPHNYARETFIPLGRADWIRFDGTNTLQRMALAR